MQKESQLSKDVCSLLSVYFLIKLTSSLLLKHLKERIDGNLLFKYMLYEKQDGMRYWFKQLIVGAFCAHTQLVKRN